MAYENIDTNSLSRAIYSIDNIKCSGLDNLANSFNASDWDSKSRNRVKTAIEKLSSEYETLNKKINNLKNLPDKIKQYQNLKKTNERYEQRRSNLRYEYNNTDPEKEWKRNGLLGDINWFTREINSNSSKMNALQREINNLLEG